MKWTISNLMTLMLGLNLAVGCFSLSAMEVKYKAAAEADLNLESQGMQADEQYKLKVATLTADFINHMQSIEPYIKLHNEGALKPLQAALASLQALMAELPRERAGVYDTALKDYMSEHVYKGLAHLERGLQELRELLLSERKDKFDVAEARIGRLNYFREYFFALLEQWEAPLPYIHNIVHSLLKRLEVSESAELQSRNASVRTLFGKLTSRIRNTGMVAYFMGGKELPLGLNSHIDFALNKYDITYALKHIQCIEHIMIKFLQERGIDVHAKHIQHMRKVLSEAHAARTQNAFSLDGAVTFGHIYVSAMGIYDALHLVPEHEMLPEEKKSELAAALFILNECERAQEAPLMAAKVRQCLTNLDTIVNVLNRSLELRKAQRIVGTIIQASEATGVRLTQEERKIIADVAVHPKLRIDYPIVEIQEWKRILDAVEAGTGSVARLMNGSAEQVERYNKMFAALLLKTPEYRKFLERALGVYTNVKTAVSAVSLFTTGLNGLGFNEQDIVRHVHALIDEQNPVGAQILRGLQQLNIPTLNTALQRIRENQAGINDAALALYHAFGCMDAHGIRLTELGLKYAPYLDSVLGEAKSLADAAESSRFAFYLTQKFNGVTQSIGGTLKAGGAVAKKGAALLHDTFGMHARSCAEALQIIAETNKRSGFSLPETVTQVPVSRGMIERHVQATAGNLLQAEPFRSAEEKKKEEQAKASLEEARKQEDRKRHEFEERQQNARELEEFVRASGSPEWGDAESLQEEYAVATVQAPIFRETHLPSGEADQTETAQTDDEGATEMKRMLAERALAEPAAEPKTTAAARVLGDQPGFGLGLVPGVQPQATHQEASETEAKRTAAQAEPVAAPLEQVPAPAAQAVGMAELKQQRDTLHKQYQDAEKAKQDKLRQCDVVTLNLREAQAQADAYEAQFASWPRLQRLYRWWRPSNARAEAQALEARRTALQQEAATLEQATGHRDGYRNSVKAVFRAAVGNTNNPPLTEEEVGGYFNLAVKMRDQHAAKARIDALHAEEADLNSRINAIHARYAQQRAGWGPRSLFNRLKVAVMKSDIAEIKPLSDRIAHCSQERRTLEQAYAQQQQEFTNDVTAQQLRGRLAGAGASKLALLKAVDERMFNILGSAQ